MGSEMKLFVEVTPICEGGSVLSKSPQTPSSISFLKVGPSSAKGLIISHVALSKPIINVLVIA